jgi:hypothetical protein
MLSDKNFKVVSCYMNSSDVFPAVDIKGGVAIVYRDETQNFGAIGQYFPNDDIKNIYKQVKPDKNQSLATILCSSTSYQYTKQLDIDFKEVRDRAKDKLKIETKLKTYVASQDFERYPEFFLTEPAGDTSLYYKFIGRAGGKRTERYILRKYVKWNMNLDKYKVFIPSSNGSGAIGETLATPLIGEPLIGEPLIGANQTFISLGFFETKCEAESLLKYIKTKFARTMLGVTKVTQTASGSNFWSNVPLQDFTAQSEIDWRKSISEIDKQLYMKYKLTAEQIEYIENNISEMK